MPSKETLQFIKEYRTGDIHTLALQADKFPQVDMAFAINQIAGSRIAAVKIPSWHQTEGILYPSHLSLEQCSSEATARYKASLIKGNTLLDLTGGFGVDCAFLSQNFQKAVYVERQPELCEIARNNFSILNLNHIEVVNSDGLKYLKHTPKIDCIFLDPARRGKNGNKLISISDCEPDAKELSPFLLEKAEIIFIKLSPMLDLSLALQEMPLVKEVHIISVTNECKELLLILGKDHKQVSIHCANLKGNNSQFFSYAIDEELSASCLYTSQIETYLYEPNVSLLKAGAYKIISQNYHIKKLHPNSHLYTSDFLIEDFPGRVFRCESVFSFNKKELERELKKIDKANIAIRNFPSTVAELRKRTRLKEGGEIYLFATTLANEKKVLVRCSKP